MRHIPKAYERYRHFKGKCYQILSIAKSSEDGTEQVVYQALYPPYTIYVRPLSSFQSEVDREKYPSAAQRYRFELLAEEEPVLEAASEMQAGLPAEAPSGAAAEETACGAVHNTAGAEETACGAVHNTAGAEETACGAVHDTAGAEETACGAVHNTVGVQETEEIQAPDDAAVGAAEEMIDEDVLAFLDAGTYEQKMNIFSALHDKVTQEMLNTIAVSLDIEVDSGDLEERYRQIQNCLQTFQKYECTRLR